VVLEDADERCTLAVCETETGDGVKLTTGSGETYSQHCWPHVSAFVSAYVPSGNARNAGTDGDWVVKIVYRRYSDRPQVKSTEVVFRTRFGESLGLRRTFHDWVLERGFDLLLDLDVEREGLRRT
jgi:hypothetical protein